MVRRIPNIEDVEAYDLVLEPIEAKLRATGPVRMDMHGEPKGGQPDDFYIYWKERNLTEAKGAFTAPVEGTHGWYWRNGGENSVTLTLKTTGFYQELFKPPVD